jgi:hypothetical protein
MATSSSRCPSIHSIRARRRGRRLAWRHQRPQRSILTPAPHVIRFIEPEGDFEAEVSSLRPSVRRPGTSGWYGVPFGTAPLSRGARLRRIVLIGALLGFALLAATGSGQAFLTLLAGTPPVAGAPLIETLAQSGGIVCLRDAAWSPNSRYIAFIGNARPCNPDHFIPAQIDIYDARSRRLVRQLHPDTAVLAALRAAAGPQASSGIYRPQVITYQSLLWSPDGTRIALSFLAVASWDPAQFPYDGLLAVPATGGAPHVLLRRETSGALGALYLEWDLLAGRAIVARRMPAIEPQPFSAAPALAYAWQNGGPAFAPMGMPAGSIPRLLRDLSPIGRPAGGTTVSIWQPGWLELDWESGSGDIHAVGLYTWHTSFSAWSPNGRYIVDRLSTAARIEPLGFRTPAHSLVNGALSKLPLLPVRDAGLEHVLEGLLDTPRGSGPPAPWLAWRPDGRVLAAQAPSGVGVAFYDCATGRLLGVRNPPAAGVTLSGEMAAPRWSPDGTMLVLPNGALLTPGPLGL